MLYEYKPQISTQIKGSSIKDMLELFLQGFYCSSEHKLENCVLTITMWGAIHALIEAASE